MSHNHLLQTSFGVFHSGAYDVTYEITSDVTFNIACELSQPMGKTEFFSTAKKRNKLFLKCKKIPRFFIFSYFVMKTGKRF